MSKIKALQEKRAALVGQARAKLDEITDNTDEARAKEIETEFDAMMAEADRLEASIVREQKLEDEERKLDAPDPRRPKGKDGEARGVTEPEPIKYEDVFTTAVRFGVHELTSEQRAVLMAGRADIPKEMRAQAVGTDAAGGYTVPEGFSGEIDKAMAIWGPMLDPGVTRQITTSSGNKLPWPTVDDTANTGRIKAENAAADDDGTDDVVFGEKQLDAYVYDTGIVRVPYELLQDSAFSMETLLADLFGERLGRTGNTALTTGTGSSQPNGIVTASSLGKTAAAIAVFTGDELIDLFHSVDAAYRGSPQCRWQFNDTTLGAVRKLKDGQGNYLWQDSNLRTGEPSTFLGKPYSVNQALPNASTGTKPIIFGDHSRYIVRRVRGFTMLTLRERYAENFQVGMIAFQRLDGELLNTAAVKHLIMA